MGASRPSTRWRNQDAKAADDFDIEAFKDDDLVTGADLKKYLKAQAAEKNKVTGAEQARQDRAKRTTEVLKDQEKKAYTVYKDYDEVTNLTNDIIKNGAELFKNDAKKMDKINGLLRDLALKALVL